MARPHFSLTWSAALVALTVGAFLFTRAHIWVNKPRDFTEIVYSYMPYAHLWAGGTQPYLEQWYEYPPATIPLFSLPHRIDMTTLRQPWHIDYANAYRGQLLILDTALFAVIWLTLAKQKVKSSIRYISLWYYLLATAKANHFIYDTMDITFAAALLGTVALPILFTNSWGMFGQWLSYWLGVGLKLLNGPLGLVYAAANLRLWKKNIVLGILAFVLIWGAPLMLYRSSLQVMLVFHQIRGLQIDSAGAVVVRTIDAFTRSEKVIEVYKNYEISGPVTDVALKVVNGVFWGSLVVFLLYGSYTAFRAPEEKKLYVQLTFTLGYIFLLMLTSKVLSRPFLLWHVPLLAIYPFQKLRTQLQFLIPSLIAIFLTLSPIPDVQVGIFRTALFVGIARTLCFVWLFALWFAEHRKRVA